MKANKGAWKNETFYINLTVVVQAYEEAGRLIATKNQYII